MSIDLEKKDGAILLSDNAVSYTHLQYKEHLMDNILVAENKVKSLAISIPNAKEGKMCIRDSV